MKNSTEELLDDAKKMVRSYCNIMKIHSEFPEAVLVKGRHIRNFQSQKNRPNSLSNSGSNLIEYLFLNGDKPSPNVKLRVPYVHNNMRNDLIEYMRKFFCSNFDMCFETKMFGEILLYIKLNDNNYIYYEEASKCVINLLIMITFLLSKKEDTHFIIEDPQLFMKKEIYDNLLDFFIQVIVNKVNLDFISRDPTQYKGFSLFVKNINERWNEVFDEK